MEGAKAMEGLYRRAMRGRPVRSRWMGGGLVAAVGLGVAGAMGGAMPLGAILGGLVMVGAGAWGKRCGEVVRTGGLRWTHRARGVIEVELLGGGRTWRKDLREVAARSLALEWRGWRSLKVRMVTAVFPVSWLRHWGFEIRGCGRWTRWGYRAVYGVEWLGWCVAAGLRGGRRPRFRRRACVEAMHRMGTWMEVVRGLPAGLRRRSPERADWRLDDAGRAVDWDGAGRTGTYLAE